MNRVEPAKKEYIQLGQATQLWTQKENLEHVESKQIERKDTQKNCSKCIFDKMKKEKPFVAIWTMDDVLGISAPSALASFAPAWKQVVTPMLFNWNALMSPTNRQFENKKLINSELVCFEPLNGEVCLCWDSPLGN